ncbi:heparin lyase I family protein [Larkinella humicola]|nr:heparin lyase I family protein [Larkinella humicola]
MKRHKRYAFWLLAMPLASCFQLVDHRPDTEGPARKFRIPAANVSTPAAVDGVNVKGNVVDGSLSTRWSGEGNPQYITLNLGQPGKIDYIQMGFHTSGSATRTSSFDVAVSGDSLNWTTVLANQRSAPGNTDLQKFDFPDIEGKYLRITGYGNNQSAWNSYTEIEAWGWGPTVEIPADTSTGEPPYQAGTLDVIGDWETGDASQWDGISAGSVADQFAAVTSPVRQGTFAARFTVRPGDKVRKANGTYTSGERAEATLWNYQRETLNDEYYYGWSTLFPEDWTEPKQWGIFMQWHAHTPISPPVAFSARANSVRVEVSTGSIVNAYPTEFEKSYPILTDLHKGQWNDFIVRIKFRPDATGILEVWHKLKSESTFKKVLSLTNIPTLQWTSNLAQLETNYQIPFKKDGVDGYTTGCYVQHGLYRQDTPTVENGGNINVLYQDNWCRGTSFSAVKARFN